MKGRMKLEGLGLEQQEAMQERGGWSQTCPFPGLQTLLGSADGSSGPLCRAQAKTAPPTPASHYLRHSGSRLGG